MVRLNLSLDEAESCEKKKLRLLKKRVLNLHIYKDFHLKKPKNRTSLEQLKLV